MNYPKVVLRNAQIVNEGKIFSSDILIENGKIEKIGNSLQTGPSLIQEINCEGLHVLPGMIDDQVHFREPGLTHKGTIYTESKAAVAGGITSFMEMPNTIPNTLTQNLLQDKFEIAKTHSLANYSFYMGVSNNNLEEVLKTDQKNCCGIKIFLGSSTGNMLVDDSNILENIFREFPGLIAVHCEDETTCLNNLEKAKSIYGNDIPPRMHPEIRSEEACYLSSSKAVHLAKKHGTRLHILHISTARELALFEAIPTLNKKITAEACIHHLWFSDQDYARLGNQIKWNPAIKTEYDREEIRKALLDNRIDVIATDHAPHTLEEKEKPYLNCPSGGPLVQHALVSLLELYHQGKMRLEDIVQKTSHSVSDCFQINSRGYIREGFFADLAILNLREAWEVLPENLLYKCGWSPFLRQKFHSKIKFTLVNGRIVYTDGNFHEEVKGIPLTFQ